MNKSILKIEEMQSGSVPKLIMKYSFFTFCALFFNELYNIVDTLFVSHGVGDNAMGGVSIIFPFMIIQGAISQTIGSGAASLVSRYLGKKEYEKAGEITANAMLAFYITSIIITIAGLIFIDPLLRLFGAIDGIMPYAKEYFTIILIGNIFSTGFSSIIRAEGKMVYSLLIWLIPTVINVALDAVFIYILDMGVKGAALATVICYFSSFVMSVIFFTKISVQKFKSIRIRVNTIKEIITLGIPMLLQLGSMSLLFILINKALSVSGGTHSINTFAYVSKIITFAIVPFQAITTAVSPIISYNYGAKKNHRIKQTIKYSILICEIYSLIGFMLSLFCAEQFIEIFTTDYNIINEGAYALRIISASLLSVPIALIIGTYFQAEGKKRPALIVNSSQFIFAVLCIMILSSALGTVGIWISVPASCLLSGALALLFIIKTECI